MKTLCTCAALVGSVLLFSSEEAASHSGIGGEPGGWHGITDQGNDRYDPGPGPAPGWQGMIDQRNDGYDTGPGPGPSPGPGWQGSRPNREDNFNHHRHSFWPWITPSAMIPPIIAYQSLPQNYAPQQEPLLQAWPSGPIYRDSSGEYCREYQSWSMVNGVRQQNYGTACQQPDGAWRIVR